MQYFSLQQRQHRAHTHTHTRIRFPHNIKASEMYTEQRFIQSQQHVIFDPKRFWDVHIVQLRVREAHINSITQQIAFGNPNLRNWPVKMREKKHKRISTSQQTSSFVR